MIDLTQLNERQKAAVLETEGPVLVFAGAGSGKTRVLTYRIAHLIGDMNVNPWNILAITFTNKATNQMKERLSTMLGENDVWISTFHSLCVKILYRFSEKIGYTPGFSIYDESASTRLLNRVLREKHLEEDKDKSKYAYHIGLAKNAGLSPDAYFNQIRSIEKDAMTISEVYERYDEYLKENNAMDFDDLLMKCKELLSDHPDVREYYSSKFRYIHVDEFQDTNGIQFEILKMLGEKWNNVFVVGDDDQSIYGWRGADIRNILDFNKYYPNAKVFKLEQNYRSTQAILDCANRLIKNNNARSGKSLFTDGDVGQAVEFNLYASDYEEVDSVIGKISSLKRGKGYKNNDFAILVRNNSLTRLFETNFSKMGIKYRVFGGYKFFDRKEILDVLAYLRILVNPYDGEAIMRVINMPKRGIGDTTVEQVSEYAAQKGISLFDAITEIDNLPFSGGVKQKIKQFRDLIFDLKFAQNSMDLSEFCQYLVKKVDFENYYRSTGKEEDENRWANIEEFLTYVEENYSEEDKLEEFLHTVQLNTDREEEEDDKDRVTIATMHAVKGLEFPVVFIVACEDGIIPSSQSLREANGVDEERRVMYVAVTRAQELLFISAVKGFRRKYNRNESAMPSRFMSEAKGTPVVPPKDNPWQRPGFERYVSYRQYDEEYESNIPKYPYPMQQKSGGYSYGQHGYSTSARSSNTGYSYPTQQNSIGYGQKPQIQVTSAASASTSGANKKDLSLYHAGVKVRHKKFGLGTVLIVEGTGNSATVTVAFKDLGIKKFALAVAPLEIV